MEFTRFFCAVVTLAMMMMMMFALLQKVECGGGGGGVWSPYDKYRYDAIIEEFDKW